MTTTWLPGNGQWLGLAKETTYGTPAAAPTMWIPVDSPHWEAKVTPLKDVGLRGSMASQFGQAQGMREDSLTYNSNIYSDSTFPHLMALLGGPDTVTGTAPTVTHKTSLLNLIDATHNAAPPSYTGYLFQDDGKVAQIPGMILGELKINIKANELPNLNATWLGLPATFVTAPTNTPSTLQPMPPFTASVTIGGSASTKYTDLSIDIKRNVQSIAVLNGTPGALGVYGGELTVSGSLNSIYQGTADYDLAALLANTQPALVVSLYTQGDATHPLTLQMSKVAYDTAAPQGTNSGWMTMAATFEALANATDALDSKYSPIQAQLINTSVTPF